MVDHKSFRYREIQIALLEGSLWGTELPKHKLSQQ